MSETLPATCPSCRHEVKATLEEVVRKLGKSPDLKLRCPRRECECLWLARPTGTTKIVDVKRAAA